MKLITPRAQHTTTLLADGRALSAGGLKTTNPDFGYLISSEIFDPATGAWVETGSLAQTRGLHTATLLKDGSVLLVGGDIVSERYNPASGSWFSTESMESARSEHTTTLLSDGRALVTGGSTDTQETLATSELYEAGPLGGAGGGGGSGGNDGSGGESSAGGSSSSSKDDDSGGCQYAAPGSGASLRGGLAAFMAALFLAARGFNARRRAPARSREARSSPARSP